MSIRILLLDDDEVFSEAIARTLRRRGYEVRHVGTQAAAERLLDQGQQFDLMLVDGVLPDGSGEHFIANNRELGDDTPTLFISAVWRDEEVYWRLSTELNVARVLRKPLFPEELLVQIEAVLWPIDEEPARPEATAPSLAQQPAAAPTLSDTDVELAALRESFQSRLLERLDAICAGIEAGVAGDVDGFNQARRLAHQLHGTAGCYGFQSASDIAGIAEARLEAALDGGTGASESWDGLLEELRALRGGGGGDQQRTPSSLLSRSSRATSADPVLFLAPEIPRPQVPAADLVLAESPAEALRVLREQEPICAVLVESHTVHEEIRTLREAAKDALLRIIVLTEGHSAALPELNLHAGVDRTLSRRQAAQREPLAAAIAAELQDARRTWPRVLIVDDDQDFSNQVVNELRRHRIRAASLTDPQGIVGVLRGDRPDLVLVDVMMERFSGFEVGKTVRHHEEFKELPLIFASARNDAATRAACFQAGGSDFLSKPMLGEELVARLGTRLELATLKRESAQRDATTGLLTRHAFQTQLSERHPPGGETVLLEVILEGLEQLGPDRGLALQAGVENELGHLLRSRFPSRALRGRWDRTRFLVALPGATLEIAEAAGAMLIAEIVSATGDAELMGIGLQPLLNGHVLAEPSELARTMARS